MSQPFSLLYVEDEPIILQELQEVLEMKYDHVLTASNGQEGWELFCQTKPSLVITDVQMPRMDGLEMSRKIKEQSPETPIIITSAFSDKQYLLNAISLGIDHYVTKPVNLKNLLHIIENVKEAIFRQREIKEQQQMIEEMIRLAPNPVFSIHDGRLDYGNSAFLKLMEADSLEEVRQSQPSFSARFFCRFHQRRFENLQEWAKHTEELETHSHTIRVLRKNGDEDGRVYKLDVLHTEMANRSIYALSDITEFENAKAQMALKAEVSQEELERQKKMLEVQSRLAQMGEMIGAISHQWRQPIGVIGANLSLLIEDVEQFCPDHVGALQEFSDQINHSLQYMNSTISDFRNFFSPTKTILPFTIAELLERIEILVGKQYRHYSIDFRHEGQLDVKLYGYPNELVQALINLFSNAMDAFEEHRIDHEKRQIIINGRLAEEKTMILTIEDTAGGIPKEVLSRLFEPFFTTKGEKGTGIGLHLVRMIIEENMRGRISVENGDKGARFTITLPLRPEEVGE